MPHRNRGAAITASLVLLPVAAGLAPLGPMGPGPSLPGGATPLALATEPSHILPTMGSPTALLAPARVALEDNALVLVPEDGGDPIRVVWPTGWAPWRRDGRAELVSRDGAVVGREGDVVSGFSGGVGADDAFHVCVVGG